MDASETREKLLEFFRAGGMVETRLRETGGGDMEFLQHGALGIPGGVLVSEEDFIRALRQMEQDGSLGATEWVVQFDSSEYVVQWVIRD